LDKIQNSGEEAAIAEATTTLQGAQSALRIAPVEWIPEPVRVSHPSTTFFREFETDYRSSSHLSQNHTRSYQKCHPSLNLPITQSSRSQLVQDTLWQSQNQDTPIHGV
jgi:hypothetical protein